MDRRFPVLLALIAACSSDAPETAPGGPPPPDAKAVVSLPGGAVGIGFDDLRFSSRLGRVVVPAGRTGAVFLVEPDTGGVTTLGGFSAFEQFDGSDQRGVGSADEGGGLIYALDRSAFKLGVVDPDRKALVASVDLEHTAVDYVRWSEPTSEVWITNPAAERIDVLGVASPTVPVPIHAAFIAVPGGCEGLTIDRARGRAYTHTARGLAVIDLKTRSLVAEWPTGCQGHHGIPSVDEERGFVFAGCASTEVVVLDAKDGTIRGRRALGEGRTILAYAPDLHHFYLRGDPGASIEVLAIGADGVPSALGRVSSATVGHCATADDRKNLWVCDAASGRILRFADPYPRTP